MEVPLLKTYEATPAPKLVVAVGDCAKHCGVFKGSYAVIGSVSGDHTSGRFRARLPARTRRNPAGYLGGGGSAAAKKMN